MLFVGVALRFADFAEWAEGEKLTGLVGLVCATYSWVARADLECFASTYYSPRLSQLTTYVARFTSLQHVCASLGVVIG